MQPWPEPDGGGISARLWRLPEQLLLALINATAILVIVAAIFALVVIARINGFAENVVATTTEAVLSKVDLPQKDVLANIRNLTAEVRTLALREIRAGEHPALQPQLAQLKEALTVLNVSVERLGSARSILTDEAIWQLGRTVTDALTKLRDCPSSAGQMGLIAPSETGRSKPGSPSRKPSMKIEYCAQTLMKRSIPYFRLSLIWLAILVASSRSCGLGKTAVEAHYGSPALLLDMGSLIRKDAPL